MPSRPLEAVNWLRAVPDGWKVNQINLPGTHNSAAINASFSTLWACHNTTISQQLSSGIRIIDLRIKVIENGNNYDLYTCHGDIAGNTYQDLPSALDECRNFLQSHSTEFIAIILKIDDWNGAKNQYRAFLAIQGLLDMYPVWRGSNLPTLGSVRGKIYLLNRIKEDLPMLGVPVSWMDNVSGAVYGPNHNRNFSLFVQDKYHDLNLLEARSEKIELFTHSITRFPSIANESDNFLFINFASAVSLVFGVYINGLVTRYLGQPRTSRPTVLGWSLFDYEADTVVTEPYGSLSPIQLIIASNFGYRGFEQAFTVVGDGHDEL